MKLVLNNITYHNCPVHLREKVSFTAKQQQFMLRQMHTTEAVSEAVILQTCNRLEFYLYAAKTFDCRKFLADLVSNVCPDAADTWKKYSAESSGIDVVRHLFEVAAGLDSQMIGENQILSQVKSAYTTSIDCRMSKIIFHRLFHNAFRAGKAVRTQTNINCGAVSISLAAVETARSKIDLPASSAMVIGAGENAELAAKYLLKAKLKHLIVANRNSQKAKDMISRLRAGRTIALGDIVAELDNVDVIIGSTSSAEPIVTYKDVKDSLAHREKPLLVIDIAVPRDIDPEIGRLECIEIYNIDDLNEQVSSNMAKRSSEIPKARKIVDEFTDKFEVWLKSLDFVPAISQLTQKALQLAHSEAARYAKDFAEGDSDKLRAFAESLVKKVLHGPVSFIKAGDTAELSSEQLQAVDLINKMFLSQNDND